MKHSYRADEPLWLNYTEAISKTWDIDPTYNAIHGAMKDMGEAKTHRVLAGMALYYHLGFSCQLAEQSTDENFWDVLGNNYEGTKRGTERRYFRGEQGRASLKYIKDNYKTPTDFLLGLHRDKYSDLLKAFGPVPAFGPYFVWKMGDIYDRILGMPIQADNCIEHLPSEPFKGMELVRKEMIARGDASFADYTPQQMFEYMESQTNKLGLIAPPAGDRLLDIREIETAMCGLKHFYTGTDYVGKDLVKHSESLLGYGETADLLRSHMPPVIARDYFMAPASVIKLHGPNRKIDEEGSNPIVKTTGLGSFFR
ncbi:conserved hypothetical protein [Delftia phage PhiW-14]|uniref:Putrescinyltransferase n=1 Tax=Delftia phage PhiW-14 TaxID=665032 RepID=PUTDT_BPW14|nr:hypothetical protein DP-phiW-14_gp110 [Delftia phage PhiW-14]C9DG80.1 RecName: Full=Putrescinyltransferase; AltName: Full=Amino acid:DNA transferase; Short=AADT [Delftia phage PhiW-14]ACV50131.1 conserved hypothetical protein [Delftia phage PhiW-14]